MAQERESFHGGHAGAFEPGVQRQRAKRPQTDYGTSFIQYVRNRRRDRTVVEHERPSPSYVIDMLPPAARPTKPADTVPVKHLHSSLNKIKHPINVVRWTPEGRRLLTGSSAGEFTLWNGMGFNFETIMQAHESAIRTAVWSHNDDWLISADHDGIIKYWQPNFNNVKAIQGHDSPIRELSFSPTDIKFVSASDDSTLKIWDFAAGVEEATLTGHGWDAKTVDWHPSKGLLVSGSKDHQVKLWDPRNGRCLTTLHGHKTPISKTVFEPSRGQLLATCAKDPTARIFDLRMMRDVLLLRGHERDVITLAWHPFHTSLLSTTSTDGSLYHYLLDEPNPPAGTSMSVSPYSTPDPTNAPAQNIYPAHRIQHAHESAIWSLAWHPIGHILASGSNDRVTRFWSRARPGDVDCYNDRYHLGEAGAEAHGTWSRRNQRLQTKEEEDQEAEDEADGLEDQNMPSKQPALPGLPGISATAPRDGTSTGGAQILPAPINISSLPNLASLPSHAVPSHSGLANQFPAQMPDITKLAEMFSGKLPLLPPPGMNGATGHANSMPSLPGFSIPPPPPTQYQNGTYPSTNTSPPGATHFNQPPPGYPSEDAQSNGGVHTVRRRGPLPSQQDSLREEIRKGRNRQQR